MRIGLDRRIGFVIYFIAMLLTLTVDSWISLQSSISGKGYFTIVSLEHPLYIYTLFSSLTRIIGIPLVFEMYLYRFLLTLVSAVTIYVLLEKLVMMIMSGSKPEKNYFCVPIMIGSLIYVFYPRMLLIDDLGVGFVAFKALLPLYLLFSVDAMLLIGNKRQWFIKTLAASTVLAASYIITIDARVVIHATIIGFALMIAFSAALLPSLKEILKGATVTSLLTLTLVAVLSAPRLYEDVFIRSLPIGARVAYVQDAFLYSWTTPLTSLMGLGPFFYPFYKSSLGSLLGFLILPSLGITAVLIHSGTSMIAIRIKRVLLVLCLFLVILIGVFSSPKFLGVSLFEEVAFSKWLLNVINQSPHLFLIKVLILLFRAPRLLDDFVHMFLSLGVTLLFVSIWLIRRGLFFLIKLILVVLLIVTIILWQIPGGGTALIGDVNGVSEARYYEDFLHGNNNSVISSLETMLYQGNPGGYYLVKEIFPVKPYWRADGTIANFVYEFIREKIYTRDLFSLVQVMRLYGMKYFIVNTAIGWDPAVEILNSSSYFSFYKKIGFFYIFRVNEASDYPSVVGSRYALTIGGLETFTKFMKILSGRYFNSSEPRIVPIFDDSWNYDIDFVLNHSKIVIFMDHKNVTDLVYSYLLTKGEYSFLIIPSAFSYRYDPQGGWSPAYAADWFNAPFPYFGEFPAPYTYEYGYNPGYGFVWTLGKNVSLSMKINVQRSGYYLIMPKYLITPKNSALLIKVDNNTFVIHGSDPSSGYSYLKAGVLGPIFLKEGRHVVELVNLDGFNMVNTVMLVDRSRFEETFRYVQQTLKDKIIISVSLEKEKISGNANITDVIGLLKTNYMLNVNCKISGKFYRSYSCTSLKPINIEGDQALLVPELYGLMASDYSKSIGIPVMYVLQGFTNITGMLSLNVYDIHNNANFYSWLFFVANVLLLTASLLITRIYKLLIT